VWAKTNGFPVVNSYFNPGGVMLCLASPTDIDTILLQGTIKKVTGISMPLQPVHGQQVEIEDVFEMAITGLSSNYDLDDLHDMLKEWLAETFVSNDETTFAGTRTVTSEPEMFIFHMTTWKATCEVLSDSSRDRFLQAFKPYEMLQPPQLLHVLNTSSLGKRPGSVCKDLTDGAMLVTEGINKLHREFNDYKEVNNQMHDATQLQLTNTTLTLMTLTNTVNSMEDRIVMTQHAILFQSQEMSLMHSIMELRLNTLSARLSLLMEADKGKKIELATLLGSMQKEENRLKMELTKMGRDFLTLVQGAAVG
jgi:hypothetical protein